MIPVTKKAARNHIETLKAEAGHSFFDVPYGAAACTCGGKVVAQGRCQTCYDKFVRGVKSEHVQMKKDIEDKDAEYKKEWKLF